MLTFAYQKQSNMYIVIGKQDEKTAVIKDKTELSAYINKSVSTIKRKEHLKKWETNKHIIYIADYIQIKSNSGGKRERKEPNDYF